MAFLIGGGFAALVFLILTTLGTDLGVAMLGIALLRPGIALLHLFFRNCCQSLVPMLAVNGLIYSAVVLVAAWPLTATLPPERLRRLCRSLTWFVLATLAFGWAGAAALSWAWSAPSDAAMTRQFSRHRDGLEALATMAKEDSMMSRIAFDFTWRQDSVAWPRPEAKWGITRARWDQYRRLFRQVGVSEGLTQDRNGNIYFLVHTQGSVVGGASKGFVYCLREEASPDTFSPCSEQRDFGRRDDGKGEGDEYRRLSQHWFIYSDWD
jgi:hypothetical protein